MPTFEENKHPRDSDGKFTTKGNEGGKEYRQNTDYKQILEDKYNSEGGQLIVLYGRRRIGKTETLKKFCKGKQHIYFSCRECTDKLQLKNF